MIVEACTKDSTCFSIACINIINRSMYIGSKTYGISIIISLFILISCSRERYKRPIKNPLTIISNFNTFWDYWNKYVKLGQDYISLNQNGEVISKEDFLKTLLTGSYLPLGLITNYGSNCYKLYKLPNTTDSFIRKTISASGRRYYRYLKMEGTQLPGFHFLALNGKVYTSKTCKDKIIVINTWFIHCSACISEILELNELVDSLKNKKNIIFLGLALDNEEKLISFLQNKDFKYIVIPDMGIYIKNILKFHLYPTHMIVNKEGKIEVITNDYKQMKYMLNRDRKS